MNDVYLLVVYESSGRRAASKRSHASGPVGLGEISKVYVTVSPVAGYSSLAGIQQFRLGSSRPAEPFQCLEIAYCAVFLTTVLLPWAMRSTSTT